MPLGPVPLVLQLFRVRRQAARDEPCDDLLALCGELLLSLDGLPRSSPGGSEIQERVRCRIALKNTPARGPADWRASPIEQARDGGVARRALEVQDCRPPRAVIHAQGRHLIQGSRRANCSKSQSAPLARRGGELVV